MLKQSLYFPGYSLIGEGLCIHKSGDLWSYPYQCCQEDVVSSQILCEDDCSSWTSCIAYQYNDRYGCCLIPSEKSCPSGFKKEISGPIAASMNELTFRQKDSYPTLVCYGKA